jgi:MFS family permease
VKSFASWAVVRQPLFRSLWLGGFATNLAIWLQTVGAAWLMTQMTSSPLMIALVQTASSLPGMLFGLLGGALADIFDRRKLMISTLASMAAVASLLATLGHFDLLSPGLLLVLIFALGTGFALYLPAYSSIGSDVVPPGDVSAALNLASIAFNSARVIGPALGGAIVATVGGSAVFALATTCYLGTLAFLLRWQPALRDHHLPPERLLSAMKTAMRYLRHTPEFQKHLTHGTVFMMSGSAIWALLPVLARDQLGMAAGGYGLLLGSLGAGGVIGALSADWLRHHVSINALIIGCGLAFAAACVLMPHLNHVAWFCSALVLAGVGWVSLVATINVSIQMSQPPWIRARAISIFALSAYMSLALGSAFWGTVATHVGTSSALTAVAIAVVIAMALVGRFPLRARLESEITPYEGALEPSIRMDPGPEDGPVLIQIRYRVHPQQRDAFVRAVEQLGRTRRRRGARFWRLYRDMEADDWFVERFTVDTWSDHLRQIDRMTVADRIAEEEALRYLVEGSVPTTSHYLAEACS